MVFFIIRVIEQGKPKYLFSKRLLLEDMALARRFTTMALAKRYIRRSEYATYSFTVIPVVHHEPSTDYRTLGSIVE